MRPQCATHPSISPPSVARCTLTTWECAAFSATWQGALGSNVSTARTVVGGGFLATLPIARTFHASVMSCCGTPAAKKGADEKNRQYPQYPTQSPVNQQPSPQPGLGWQEKPYQPPSIPSPPPTHYSHGTSHSPPPQSTLNHSYQQPGFNPNNLGGTTYPAPSITRPPPSLPPSPPPVGSYGPISTVSPLSPTKGYTIPTDEGKLSVSIDFGMSTLNSLEHPSRSLTPLS